MCKTRLVSAIVGSLSIVVVAVAQDSGPTDPIHVLKPAMMELQKGSWTPDAARGVIETLLVQKHEAAAGWWTTLSEEAVKDKKLPGNFQTVLKAFRKRCEAEGATADDRKLALKMVRHLESLVASRNFDEAKKVAAIGKVLLLLVPDPVTARCLDEAGKKIGSGNNDPSNLGRQQKQFSEIEEAIVTTIRTRVEGLLAEFRAAGCRPGRLLLKNVIKGAAPLVGDQHARTWSVDLGKAARTVEPTHTLSVLMRPLGEIRVFRDGEEGRLLEREPLELQALPGEILQFRIPQYSKEEGKRAFYVVATSARLDGKALGVKHWFLNGVDDPLLLDPPLRPTEVLRVGADDSRLKAMLKPPPERGGFIAPDGDRAVAVGADVECAEIEKEFEQLKLKPLWLGAFDDACVLVLRVPDA